MLNVNNYLAGVFTATDPCALNRGGCEQHCVNDNGRAVCQCYQGLTLGPDRKSCIGTKFYISITFDTSFRLENNSSEVFKPDNFDSF